MRKAIGALMAMTLLLGGCSAARESRLNPFNWFGGEAAGASAPAGPAAPQSDPRPVVAQLVSARLEPLPGGAILHAVGRPPSQGYWRAALVAEPDAPAGQLRYTFRAEGPLGIQPIGTPPSREITAALFLSDQALERVREVIVQGETGTQRLRP